MSRAKGQKFNKRLRLVEELIEKAFGEIDGAHSMIIDPRTEGDIAQLNETANSLKLSRRLLQSAWDQVLRARSLNDARLEQLRELYTDQKG